ncbi:hypothetical protein [Pedobacter sp. AJM]|uniref:DUF6843 domain-containing protein n=1 Tax=Pedobacter TaxID=84567 RepID=UPI000B4B9462|nr:hypothetical protein [Pedobacter sp. AJM]OWK68753.1 hypothetical protein CBW18_20455 [Pedobacter sp. AJM]
MNTLLKIKEFDAHRGPENVKMGGGDGHVQTATTVGSLGRNVKEQVMDLKRLIGNKFYFLGVLLCCLVFSCAQWDRPQIKYLVPEGYDGMIVIAWGQKNGSPVVTEDDFEVYKIPENGFFRTQKKSRNIAPVEEKFYSYNIKTGKRTELEVINADLVTDTITKPNQIYQLRGFSAGNEKGNYMVLYLTKNRNYKSEHFKNQEELDERINQLSQQN